MLRTWRAAILSLLAFTLLAPSWGSAQTRQPFEDLGLQVDLGDRLRVEDQSQGRTVGRLTRITRDEIAIQTDAGEKRFTSGDVRTVAARRHSLRKPALVGAAVVAAIGAVAVCAHEGGGGCFIVGALAAAPIGAGLGLAWGGLVPVMKTVYRAPESTAFVPGLNVARSVQNSLFDALAPRVNLHDRLQVEERSGATTTGRVIRLTEDELTLSTNGGQKTISRTTIRQIAVQRQRLRLGVLVGAGAGAATGAVLACTGSEREECADASMIGGAIGAGLGLAAGALMHRTTVVYPDNQARTSVLPVISRSAVGVRVSRRW